MDRAPRAEPGATTSQQLLPSPYEGKGFTAFLHPTASTTRLLAPLLPATGDATATLPQGRVDASAASVNAIDGEAPSWPKHELPKPLRICWSDLLRRTFKIDALCCPRCAGRVRQVATIKDKTTIDKILTHLGLPTVPPPTAPARAPCAA